MSATESTTPSTTQGMSGTSSGTPSKTEQLSGHAQDVAGTAKEETRQLAASATDHAATVMRQATDELRSHGEEQGQKFAATLRDLCDDLRSMADHSTGKSPAGDIARSLADGAEQLAGRIDHGGINGIGRDLTNFGRRSPGRFLLMSAAAGVLAGRVLRNTDTRAIAQAAGGQQGNQMSGSGVGMGMPSDGLPEPVIDLPAGMTSADPLDPSAGDAIAAGMTGTIPAADMGDMGEGTGR
jgi:hypothetical protein